MLYGWPRIWKELLARGIHVGKDRVQKLMQLHGIKARGKRCFKVTTDSKHDLPISPKLLDRGFTVAEPGQVWVGDITYIANDEGWLFFGCGDRSIEPSGGGLVATRRYDFWHRH